MRTAVILLVTYGVVGGGLNAYTSLGELASGLIGGLAAVTMAIVFRRRPDRAPGSPAPPPPVSLPPSEANRDEVAAAGEQAGSPEPQHTGDEGVRLDRLTARSHRVLALGKTEANRRNYRAVGTGHIVGVLMIGEGGKATEFLRSSIPELRELADDQAPLVSPNETSEQLPYGSDLRSVLVLATEEAMFQGHELIDPEHLVLGVLREKTGVGGEALRTAGLRVDDVRRELFGSDAATSGSRIDSGPSLEEIVRYAEEHGEDERAAAYHLLSKVVRRGELPASTIGLRAAGHLVAMALDMGDRAAVKSGMSEVNRLRALGISDHESGLDGVLDELAEGFREQRFQVWLRSGCVVAVLLGVTGFVVGVVWLAGRVGLDVPAGVGDLSGVARPLGGAVGLVVVATLVRTALAEFVVRLSWKRQPSSRIVDVQSVLQRSAPEVEVHSLDRLAFGRRAKTTMSLAPAFWTGVPLLSLLMAVVTGYAWPVYIVFVVIGGLLAQRSRQRGRIMYERAGFESIDELDQTAAKMIEERSRSRNDREELALYLGSFVARGAGWAVAALGVTTLLWEAPVGREWLVDHVAIVGVVLLTPMALSTVFSGVARRAVLGAAADPTAVTSDQAGSVILRSFADDQASLSYLMDERLRAVEPLRFVRTASFEVLSTSALGALGNVVAVGDPRTHSIPALGAGRLFFADEHWRQAVEVLIERSKLPVVSLACTEAVRDEIGMVVRSPRFRSTLFVVPPGTHETRSSRLRFAEELLGLHDLVSQQDGDDGAVLGFALADKLHVYRAAAVSHHAYIALFQEAFRTLPTTEGRPEIMERPLPPAVEAHSESLVRSLFSQ